MNKILIMIYEYLQKLYRLIKKHCQKILNTVMNLMMLLKEF